MLRFLKWVGLSIGGLILAVVLFFGYVVLRKSVPYFYPGDIEQLAASGPLNDAKLASEICGAEVDMLGGPDPSSPETALPHASVVSWRPLYPAEGAATVRVSGHGVRRAPPGVTGPCEATITFKYHLQWQDNGRAVVLDSQFTERPKVVR